MPRNTVAFAVEACTIKLQSTIANGAFGSTARRVRPCRPSKPKCVLQFVKCDFNTPPLRVTSELLTPGCRVISRV